MILSPGCSRVPPRGMVKRSPALTATIRAPGGRPSSEMRPAVRGEPGSSRYSSRRIAPPANASASMAPGAAMIRSMSSASCASGQMTRLMPKCSRRPSPSPSGRRKSSFETKQIVSGCPRPFAIEQATTLTSSRPVQATSRSACSMWARRSTLALVALPVTSSTSRLANSSPTAGSWSTTKTSCRGASALASANPTSPPPMMMARMIRVAGVGAAVIVAPDRPGRQPDRGDEAGRQARDCCWTRA